MEIKEFPLVGGPLDGKLMPCSQKHIYFVSYGMNNSYEGSAIYIERPRGGGIEYRLIGKTYHFVGYVQPEPGYYLKNPNEK